VLELIQGFDDVFQCLTSIDGGVVRIAQLILLGSGAESVQGIEP